MFREGISTGMPIDALKQLSSGKGFVQNVQTGIKVPGSGNILGARAGNEHDGQLKTTFKHVGECHGVSVILLLEIEYGQIRMELFACLGDGLLLSYLNDPQTIFLQQVPDVHCDDGFIFG
jgi:hypothetical protein